MCELLGASSARVHDWRDPLLEFYSHGTQHPHGWGLALLDRDAPLLEKEPILSLQSRKLNRLLAGPVQSELLLAHIRLATKGSIDYPNTHPFVGTDRSGVTWTLIHNGTIFESEVLRQYIYRQEGTTDSERILDYLVDCMNRAFYKKGTLLSVEERAAVLEELLQTITPENKVNLLISDGTYLYAHTNYKGSLHLHFDDDGALIATRPVWKDGWEELPMNTLLVFEDGELIYEGTPHDNEFFDSEEKMRYLFLDYAGM